MTEDQIRQEIKEIKHLIVNRRFKKAFLKLAELIEVIDHLDKTDTDDVELENQFLMIRSRFENFNNESTKGVPTSTEEINQITYSILQFLDEVKEIAIEYVDPNDQKEGQSFEAPDETIATGAIANTAQNNENGGISGYQFFLF